MQIVDQENRLALYKARRRDLLLNIATRNSHLAQATCFEWTARASSLSRELDRAAMYTKFASDYKGYAESYDKLVKEITAELEGPTWAEEVAVLKHNEAQLSLRVQVMK